MERPAGKPLLDHFAALEDPRQQAKVLYPLPEIVLLRLGATLAGADDFVEIQLWGNQHLAFLRRFRPDKWGVPSHDTLGEVIAAIDPALFKACFTAWVEGLRAPEPDLVAVLGLNPRTGTTSRRTHARAKGREPLHLVSAWARRQRLVLGQEAVAAKSNAITAIPPLRERLALAGALVTLDALKTRLGGAVFRLGVGAAAPNADGTQAEIAATIRARGGDDLLALKGNRPATFAELEAFFADPPPGALDTHATTDGGHGRIELRRHAVCHDVGWLFSARRYSGEAKHAASPPSPTWP